MGKCVRWRRLRNWTVVERIPWRGSACDASSCFLRKQLQPAFFQFTQRFRFETGLVGKDAVRDLCTSEEAAGTSSQQGIDEAECHHVFVPWRGILFSHNKELPF